MDIASEALAFGTALAAKPAGNAGQSMCLARGLRCSGSHLGCRPTLRTKLALY